MKKYIVWAVTDKNKELIVDQTSFYGEKDFAEAIAKEMNRSITEKKKPYKVKRACLII